jgi:hypothetical protein
LKRSVLTLNFFVIADRGLWGLWAEGGAVDNGFIVIHGQPPASPSGELPTKSTDPKLGNR